MSENSNSNSATEVILPGLAKLLDPATGPGSGATTGLDLTQAAPTQSGMVMGTPAYMSPEQVRGTPVHHRACAHPSFFRH